MSMNELTEMQPAPRPEPAGRANTDIADKVPAARAALVKVWLERVQKSAKHFKPDFDQMAKNQQIAAEGADEAWVKADNYTVPIIKRHIDQSVAQLYAKDPRAVAKLRKKLLYTLWDGKPETIEAAVMAVTPPPPPLNAAGQPIPADPLVASAWQPDPNAMALLQEVIAATEYKRMAERAGKTMEGLWRYFTAEQSSGFKTQMKAVVRRTKVNCVGYVKLAFQRLLTKSPEIAAQIDDVTSQIAALEAGMVQIEEGDVEADSARAEELRLLQQQLESKLEIIGREGPIFDFPRSNEIIIDPACRHLKTFTGARWIAHQFDMTPESVQETYKVNIKGQFKDHCIEEDGGRTRKWEVGNPGGKKQGLARIYEIQDKKNGQFLTVCEGYPDFLREPAEPDVKIERFFTVFPLVFNEIEHDKKLYPPSDVYLARHTNSEYNRSREGLREHRIANKPKYATAKGSLDKADKDKLQSGVAHAVHELKALKPGQSVDQLLQPIKPSPIDPNLYEVNQAFQDLQRTVGSQEANIGGTSDASATESSIAENSRAASLTENVDDLDEMLSELAKATGQLMLFELSKETVVEIVGPGAVWPELQGKRDEIAKDLLLEIKAGSSGRPNRAARLADLERGMPYILQLPGVNPTPVAKEYLELLDIDLEEAIMEGLPSIQAVNAMMAKQASQPSTGDPATDPAAQGAQGGQNAQKPAGNEPQSQPAFPTPGGGAGGAPQV